MPFGVDRPLPADFEVRSLREPPPPKPKKSFPPGVKFGREAGIVNKVTRDLKVGILNGAIAHGADGSGEGGLEGYLFMCATKYPKHYLALLGKLVPLQLTGNPQLGQHISTVNVISVPSGTFLSKEDIEKEHTHSLDWRPAPFEPEPEPTPEPVQQLALAAPESASLMAELDKLSYDELLHRAGVANVDAS